MAERRVRRRRTRQTNAVCGRVHPRGPQPGISPESHCSPRDFVLKLASGRSRRRVEQLRRQLPVRLSQPQRPVRPERQLGFPVGPASSSPGQWRTPACRPGRNSGSRFLWKENSGLGSKFGRLDSGSALHVPVRKFPETTESSYFIDTRGTYRSARNDDRRDDSP